jgi:hypothetical protein
MLTYADVCDAEDARAHVAELREQLAQAQDKLWLSVHALEAAQSELQQSCNRAATERSRWQVAYADVC